MRRLVQIGVVIGLIVIVLFMADLIAGYTIIPARESTPLLRGLDFAGITMVLIAIAHSNKLLYGRTLPQIKY